MFVLRYAQHGSNVAAPNIFQAKGKKQTFVLFDQANKIIMENGGEYIAGTDERMRLLLTQACAEYGLSHAHTTSALNHLSDL